MGKLLLFFGGIMMLFYGQLKLEGAESDSTNWLHQYQWTLHGEKAEVNRDSKSNDFRIRSPLPVGATVFKSEAIALQDASEQQINAQIKLNQRSYAKIYLRLQLLPAPEAKAGRTTDNSGTYVSMPFDMRYPAGEWQWMRIRFTPAAGEKFVQVEIVAENGACDFNVARLECGSPAPRPLSPTWAHDSVSGIEPLPNYIEPEEEIIPPLTDEIRKIVNERKRENAKMEIIDGRPRFTVGGKPIVPAFYNGCWFNPRLSQYGDFKRAGVHTFLLSVSSGKNLYGSGFWTGKDTYDFADMDKWMWRILRVDPMANIIIYLGCEPYVEWGSENPDDVCADQNGNKVVVDFHTIRFGGEPPGKGERFGPSLVSEKYRRDAAMALRKLVEHLETSDLGKAVVGYHLCGFSDGQFFDWDYGYKNQHIADFSPAGMASFRNWLSRRYEGNVDKLRAAWNDPAVTFETALRPTVDQIWTDKYLVDSQQVADHNRFASEGQAETVLSLAKTLREATNGTAFIGTYYEDITGTVYNHGALKSYLTSPYIDYLTGPADYRIRKEGYSGGVRNTFGSTLLHGKMFLTEQDWRSWCSGPNSPVENFAYGRAESPEEHNAMVRRESGMMLAFGLGTWWYDLAGKWFRDDRIMGGIAEAVAAFERDLHTKGLPKADVGVFISEDTNFYHTLRTAEIMRSGITKQRVQLNTSGTPYRLYLLSDAGVKPIPQHKVYMFIDCMAINATQRKYIEGLKRDGNTLVFIGSPGIIDQEQPYTANALTGKERTKSRLTIETLTGIHLKDYEGKQAAYTLPAKHELLLGTGDRLALPLVYSSMLIDFPQDGVPVFAVQDAEATPLATFADGKHVAVAVKKLENFRVIYSAIPVLSDAFLNRIAATGGAWVVAPPGDAVYANENFMTIHAMHALNDGKKCLSLLRPSKVIDMHNGTVIAESANKIELTMKIGETRWFHLLPIE